MRSMNSKAGRRLLSMLCAAAIVVSLLCMGGVSVLAAGSGTLEKGVAFKVSPLSSLVNGTYVTVSDAEDSDGDGNSLKFETNVTSKSASQFDISGLDPRKYYTMSYQIKGGDGKLRGNSWINFFDTEGNTVQDAAGKAEAVNIYFNKTSTGGSGSANFSDWSTRTCDTAFKPYSDKIRIGFWFTTNDTTASYALYIDNIVIEEVDSTFSTSNTTAAATGEGGQIDLSVYKATSAGNYTYTIEDGGVDGNGTTLQLVTLAASGSKGKGMTFYGLDPNKLYTVSFWLKNETALAKGSNIYINGNESAANDNNVHFDKATTHTEWTKYSRTLYPTTAGSIAVGFWLTAGQNNPCYLDALSIHESIFTDVQGATIATTTDETKQDLRFTASIPGVVPDDATNIEYGAYLVRKAVIDGGTVAELTEETYQANKGVVIKGSATVATAADVPETFNINLKNAVNFANRCDVDISLRTYVKFTVNLYGLANGSVTVTPVEYIIYSENTSTSPEVTDGVATRSVYGVAKSIATDLWTNYSTSLVDSTSVTYDAASGVFTSAATGTDASDAEILAFCVANASVFSQTTGN